MTTDPGVPSQESPRSRDSGPWKTLPAVTTIAVGNANCYGGGMKISLRVTPFTTPTKPPFSSPCPQRDNGPWETLPAVTTIAVGNGSYFGFTPISLPPPSPPFHCTPHRGATAPGKPSQQ
ncbi:unnamed protein product [Closterium sp. Naga37s-1]|nr:unnamed protein product [Closterium sp. Naga37s-1]